VLPKHVMYNFYDGIDQLQRVRAAAAKVRRGGRPTALFLFGGPTQEGPEDLVAIGTGCGIDVVNYDLANGSAFDLRDPALQYELLRQIAARVYALVFVAPLCRSYSIRHVPCLRSPAEPRGIVPVPRAYARYIRNDTGLALFAVRAVSKAADAGVMYGIEHPSPRDDETSHAYWKAFAHQGTIWHDQDTRALAARPATDVFDFAQCKVGSVYQKYTRVMGHRVFLAGLRPRLHAGERCTCARHAVRATGLGDDGEYRSRAAAYYPLEMKRSLLEEGVLSIHASAQCGDRIAARVRR
jgi:hypothetical protein